MFPNRCSQGPQYVRFTQAPLFVNFCPFVTNFGEDVFQTFLHDNEFLIIFGLEARKD